MKESNSGLKEKSEGNLMEEEIRKGTEVQQNEGTCPGSPDSGLCHVLSALTWNLPSVLKHLWGYWMISWLVAKVHGRLSSGERRGS